MFKVVHVIIDPSVRGWLGRFYRTGELLEKLGYTKLGRISANVTPPSNGGVTTVSFATFKRTLYV